ncbi:hypothetical protein [Streptomyces cucumeris]|uniref:hypothetical protein n=1 Tax=Streptomyces cucumeris TaxID=2962890 RepID=UPI0020C887CA|nr:hypothetical protein [Streptomyces sp. NEAU-Y11]MCP9209538.1 hypothetical protein [Streptomyces sp. NEAU-Y11]
MADIRHAPELNRVELSIHIDELRVMVHRLAPGGSFLHWRAEGFLPEEHERIAEELSEVLRRFHDRGMRRAQ